MDSTAVFKNTLSIMSQLFIVGFAGYWALSKKMIDEKSLLSISALVIEICFPCYIFTHTIKNIAVNSVSTLILLQLSCIIMLGMGYLIASLYLKFDKSIKEQGEFKLLVAFQNAVYIPLPIIETIFSPADQPKMFLYLFMFNIPFSALLFSVSPHVLNKSKGMKFRWRTLFNNAVIAILIALIFVFTGFNKDIPVTIVKSMEMIGKVTVPLVMIVTGGIIFINSRSDKPASKLVIAKISILKLAVFPLIVTAVSILLRFPKDIGLLLVLESCVPSSSVLPLIARKEEADYKLIGANILWSYPASILTVPLFIYLYYCFADKF